MSVTVTITYEPDSRNVSSTSMEPTATRLSGTLVVAARQILAEDGVTGPFKFDQEVDLTVTPLSDLATEGGAQTPKHVAGRVAPAESRWVGG